MQPGQRWRCTLKNTEDYPITVHGIGGAALDEPRTLLPGETVEVFISELPHRFSSKSSGVQLTLSAYHQ